MVPLLMSGGNRNWKVSTKYEESLFIGPRVVTGGQKDRQTCMSKLISVFLQCLINISHKTKSHFTNLQSEANQTYLPSVGGSVLSVQCKPTQSKVGERHNGTNYA